MSSEMDREIAAERARCLALVEECRLVVSAADTPDPYETSLLTRVSNIIRNGIVPETFEDQMSSEETEYSEPATVQEERDRCLLCLRMHYDDSASHTLRTMMLDLEARIAQPL